MCYVWMSVWGNVLLSGLGVVVSDLDLILWEDATYIHLFWWVMCGCVIQMQYMDVENNTFTANYCWMSTLIKSIVHVILPNLSTS